MANMTDLFKAQWSKLKGSIKQTFGKLTDDDLEQAEGSLEKLKGILIEKYHYTQEQVEKGIKKLLNK